jgi:hypothetical protein
MTELDVGGIIEDEREAVRRRGEWLTENPSQIWYYQRWDDNEPTPMLAFERTLESAKISLLVRFRSDPDRIDTEGIINEFRTQFIDVWRAIPWPAEKPYDYEAVMRVRRKWAERDRKLFPEDYQGDPTVDRADELDQQ